MSALETGIHTLGCAGALALGIALTSAFSPFDEKIMKTHAKPEFFQVFYV